MENNKENYSITNSNNINSNKTILVVDDETALRELCAEILEPKGYRILQAENGIEALALLEKENIDLVISDIIMPIMDGHALAIKIRKLYPNMKIQLVSGYMKPNEIPEINKDLYNELLNKPVIASDLLQRVSLLLS